MNKKRKPSASRGAKSSKLKIFQRYSLFFFDKPKTTFTIWMAVLLFGFLSYTQFILREGFPSIQVPLSTVRVSYFVGDKTKVDNDIVVPISKALAEVSEVKKLDSIATDNFATVIVYYNDTVSPADGAGIVQQKISNLGLPQQSEVQYGLIDAAKFDNKYNVLVSLYSDDFNSSLASLESAGAELASKLSSLSGIGKLELVEQTTVAKSPITGQDQKIQNNFEFVGSKDSGGLVFRQAVNVGLIFDESSDSLEMSELISKALADAQEENFMTGYTALISSDVAPRIESQIASLQQNMVEGLLIVAVISFALVTWRAGLSTSLAMVTVLLTTVSVLYLAGMTLNTITLFSLILSLGLIVDDATIIGESIDVLKNETRDRREVVKIAIGRVARASAAGTLVTIMAFAPMLFIGGILGEFIVNIPITIITSLVLSLVVSLTLIPFFARGFLLSHSFSKSTKHNPIQKTEKFIANKLAKLIRYCDRDRKKGVVVTVLFIVFSFVAVGTGSAFFGKIGFDIFPKEKDGLALMVSMRFNPGSTIEQAQDQAARVNEIVSKYSEFIEQATYMNSGSTQGASISIDLTPLDDRKETSVEISQNMKRDFQELATKTGISASVDSIGAGGPSSELPIEVQIFNNSSVASREFIGSLVASLQQKEFITTNGLKFRVDKAAPSDNKNLINRQNGKQYDSVKLGFSINPTTEIITLVTDFVNEEVKTGKYSLSSDDVVVNIGQEDENQKSFQSMIIAFPILLLAMYILLAVQFRSLLQPLFIFMAIPFSFMGVGIGLYLTDNSASFFVMLGFFALIGIALNNTILITDYANQGRSKGLGVAEAIAQALEQRFRPLLTTSITSVVALIPLALTDPFWQSLSVTLIFGLLSSTLLVILCFPYYLIAAETMRITTKRLLSRAKLKLRNS